VAPAAKAKPANAGSTEERAQKIHEAVKSGKAVTMGELEDHLGLTKVKIRGVVEAMKQGKFGDLRLYMEGTRGGAVYGVTKEQAKQHFDARSKPESTAPAPKKDTRPVGPVKKRSAVRRVVEREPAGAEE
jgi:hypothetical protein